MVAAAARCELHCLSMTDVYALLHTDVVDSTALTERSATRP
jgi:hypothetical protein